MASEPLWNSKRGTWSVQYWDGYWRRVVVARRRPGWKPGDPRPKKAPPEAHAAVATCAAKEKEARVLCRKTIRQTLEQFLRAHVATYAKESSRGAVEDTVNTFLAWCKERKVIAIGDVTAAIAQQWINDCAAAEVPIAIQTSKNRIRRLSPAWNRAIRLGQLGANPWKFVEARGTPTPKVRGYWPPAIFDKLTEAANPWLRDILTIGVFTGIRISALSQLLWSDVEWAAPGKEGFGHINIRTEINKTDGYRLPIHPKLHDVLARRLLHKSADHERVICGQNGRPTRRGTVGEAIRRASTRAGLDDPDSPNHHMRRTFGRWAVLGHLTGSPVPIYVVSKWFGHASVKMTQKYLGIEDEDSTRFMLGQQ